MWPWLPERVVVVHIPCVLTPAASNLLVELDSPRQRAPPSAMKPVSAGSLASPINDTQCGAALTIYALTKTGSSFVRAHFELCCAHTQVHAHIRPRSWPSS